LAALGVVIFILITSTWIFKDSLFSTLFPKPESRAEADISTPAEVKIRLTRGIITGISGSGLLINTATGSANFSISTTNDFQRLLSGTLEGGDAVTATSSAQQLQPNQEVLIITDKLTNQVLAVYILR